MATELQSARGTDFYLMDELLSEEERGIRDKIRAFCDREVIPIINDYKESRNEYVEGIQNYLINMDGIIVL